MYNFYNKWHNVRQVFNKILFSKLKKKNNINYYPQTLILTFVFNKNLKKNSKYFIFYEFSISFLQAIRKNGFFFFCRYLKNLEVVLEILWNLHLIFGYSKIKLVNKYFFKIFLKKDVLGHSIINFIFHYTKYIYISWINLKNLISKQNSVVYILSTRFGIKEGKSALLLGLGGKLLYKIDL